MTNIRDAAAIGHDWIGTGKHGVIVMNDWLCDTSTWDDARKYLDLDAFSWLFVDLRGYGRSRDLAGEHTVREAATDVIALADKFGWQTFSIVGFSMSSLIALHLAQQSGRVDRAVVLCPPPPPGFGASDAILASMRAMGAASNSVRGDSLRMQWGERLSSGWLAYKVDRWRNTSHADAVADYSAMFGRDGMPDPTTPIAVPVLAVTGEQDWEMMRRAAVTIHLSPLCSSLEVVSLAEAGHYPMQEMPPLTVSIIERFLRQPRA